MNYLVKAANHGLLIDFYLKLGEKLEERMGSSCNPMNNEDINTIMVEEDLFFGQNYPSSSFSDSVYLFIANESDLFTVLSRLHIDELNNTYPIF